MDPEKFSYYIKGCNSNFTKIDESVYGERLARDEKTGELIVVRDGLDEFDGNWMAGPNKETACQQVTMYIPEDIFDPDNMEYVCVRQRPDTALEIVKEEDLQPGDTAVRIFIPHRFFHNRLARAQWAEMDASGTFIDFGIETFSYISLVHYIGIGLYMARV